MWRKEYRIVYYSWEFDTLQSFYRDLLRLPQMYGWYTSRWIVAASSRSETTVWN